MRWTYARLAYRPADRSTATWTSTWEASFHHSASVQRWGTDQRFDDVRHLNRAGAAGWQAYGHEKLMGTNAIRHMQWLGVTYLMRRADLLIRPWEYARLECNRVSDSSIGFAERQADFHRADGSWRWRIGKRPDRAAVRTSPPRKDGSQRDADAQATDLHYLDRAGAAGWQAYDVLFWDNQLFYPLIGRAMSVYLMRRSDPLIQWEYARLDYHAVGSQRNRPFWRAEFGQRGGAQQWGTEDRPDDLIHLNLAGAAGWQAFHRERTASRAGKLVRLTYWMRRPIPEGSQP